MKKLPLLLGILLTLSGGPLGATEAPTLDLGKTLFESTALGSQGRSCRGCHPQGDGLGQVGDFSDVELKDIINACLRDAMKAEMISPESQEMEALLAYVRGFQKSK